MMPIRRIWSLRRRRSKRVVSVSLPDIREDSVVEGSPPVTRAFEETAKVPVISRSPQTRRGRSVSQVRE